MEQNGASRCLRQDTLTPERLSAVLASIDRAQLLSMAEAARKLSHSNAASAVADMIESRADRTFRVS
jgi:UDP-N-acetylglucosamine--N-acetylmuramyl-(pentapeptide) pyrophosphoryl-undecaprenol N-acetylglucosamine transferase